MTKYNDFAKELNTAFHTAAEAYLAAADELEAAQQEHGNVHNKFIQETYIGQREDMKRKADIRLREAKTAVNAIGRSVWSAFDTNAAMLGKKLNEALEKGFRIDPDMLDSSVVTIMESGIVSADDMVGMIEKYSDNPTMLRVISQYAAKGAKAADSRGDGTERAKFLNVSRVTTDAQKNIMEAWQELNDIARSCSGQMLGNRNYEATDYMRKMLASWDEYAQAVISNF